MSLEGKDSATGESFVLDYLSDSLNKSELRAGERLADVDPDDARAFVAHADAGNFAIMRESVTPSPIVVVATEALEIADGEEVADYGCGQGFFLAYAASRHPGATYVGYEVNPTVAAVAALRMHALKLDDIVSVQVTDLFDFADSGPEYDKVFSHYPIGMRFPRIQSDSAWLREVASGGAGYGRPVVFDWVFNQLVIDTLRDGGMGVVLMSDGALVNVSDEGVRAEFVESGWIRNVVKLPRNMLHDTSAGCNLVVLASGCGGVHFLDVTGLAVEGRRKNTLSDKADEVIATYVRDETYDEEAECTQHPELFDEEKGFRPVTVACRKIVRVGDWDFYNLSKGVHSCTASAGAIALARYKLDMKYLDNTIGYDGYDMAYDPDELGEHVVSINRGVTLKASELDRASSGGAVPSISAKTLREVEIPYLEPYETEDVVWSYQSKLEEIRLTKERLERARKDLQDLLD